MFAREKYKITTKLFVCFFGELVSTRAPSRNISWVKPSLFRIARLDNKYRKRDHTIRSDPQRLVSGRFANNGTIIRRCLSATYSFKSRSHDLGSRRAHRGESLLGVVRRQIDGATRIHDYCHNETSSRASSAVALKQ